MAGIAVPGGQSAPCTLCGGPAAGPAFPYESEWNGKRFRRVGCRRCKCVYVTPLPSAADFDLMYDADNYHAVHYAECGSRPEIEESLDFLAPKAAAGSRLLDFGCGNGDFLLAAVQRGFLCQGVEQGDSSIALAAERSGAPVGTLEAVEASGQRFDIIHMADVLEHLPDPAAMLRRLEGMLAPGGRFFLEGPLERQSSLVYWFAAATKRIRRLLGHREPGTQPPTHLTVTDWASQRYFFEEVVGYRLGEHQLWETGFPYSTFSTAPANLSERVRGAIGSAAVAAARTGLGRRIGLANRFRVLADPGKTH